MNEPRDRGTIVLAGDGSLIFRRYDGMSGISWLNVAAGGWNSWAEVEAHGNIEVLEVRVRED